MAPDQIKLEELKDSTAWSLTVEEKSILRDRQLNATDEAALIEEAWNVVIDGEGNKRVKDFVSELQKEINGLKVTVSGEKVVNRKDMDREQKKTAIKNLIDTKPIFGKILGRSSELVALIQMVVKPLWWADGILGPKTADAIIAYEAPVEKPKPNATPEPIDSLPAIALKDVSTSDLKTWIADTNLNNPNIEHCDTCIALWEKYGFVKIDTEGGAYIIPEKIVVDSVKHDKATIYGKDGFKMTIPLEWSVTRADTVGNGRKFNHDIIVTNLREAAIVKNNEENALERDKVAVNAAELNKTFDTITKTFDTTMETINPEKVSQILTTYSAKKAISTGWRSAEYGYKQSINTGAKTLLSLISQLNTLKQSATDLSWDAWNAKSILLKKIDTLGAWLQEGYKKIVWIATSLDTYGKDKDDLWTYLNYLQTASVAEMVSKGGYNILLGKGWVFDDIKSLQTRLRTHSGDIAKYKGTGTIWKTFQDAYQVGIAMLDTAKADVTKKLDAAANDPANKKAFEAFKAGKRSAA